MKNYGTIDAREWEFNNVMSSAFALISAYKRDKFPAWAEGTKQYVLSDTFFQKVNDVLDFDAKQLNLETKQESNILCK